MAWEAIDDEVPWQEPYHKGEIDFRLFGTDLAWNIRHTLRLIGQPFVALSQVGVVARPTALFGIGQDGSRTALALPSETVREFRRRDEERKKSWSGDSLDYSTMRGGS